MRRIERPPELDKRECQASVTRRCDDDGVPLRWMHKVRLYPNRTQERLLEHALHLTRNLYNAALDQRKYVWTSRKRGIAAKMQCADLTALRGESVGDAAIYRELQDAVLHRLDLAYRAFFTRCKRGETPGHPRFKSDARWNQLEFPHGDRALKFCSEQRSIRVPGVGFVKLRKGRTVPENFGRAFLVRKNGKWYAVFECKRDVEPMAPTARLIGIDAGITTLIATSDGDFFENPRHFERNRAWVQRAQHALDAATLKDARGRARNVSDPKRKAKVLALARAKEREANARRDALHKRSRELVERYDGIAMEALSLRTMTRSARGTPENPGTNVRAKSGLNRALLDTGFGTLRKLIIEKAEWAARMVAVVDSRFTSQTCFKCKHVASENREGIQFVCVACGHADHADVNAAKNILAKAEWPPRRELSPGDARLTQQDAA